jgi:hypothetical protein
VSMKGRSGSRNCACPSLWSGRGRPAVPWPVRGSANSPGGFPAAGYWGMSVRLAASSDPIMLFRLASLTIFRDRRGPDVHSRGGKSFHARPPLHQQSPRERPAATEGEQVVEHLGIVAPGVRGRDRVEHHLSEQRLGRSEGRGQPLAPFRGWRRQNELIGHAAILPPTNDIVVAKRAFTKSSCSASEKPLALSQCRYAAIPSDHCILTGCNCDLRTSSNARRGGTQATPEVPERATSPPSRSEPNNQ